MKTFHWAFKSLKSWFDPSVYGSPYIKDAPKSHDEKGKGVIFSFKPRRKFAL